MLSPAGNHCEHPAPILPAPAPAVPTLLLPWFGIRVRSCCEHVAAATLRNKGFEEFLPLVRSRRRWSDRVKEIRNPLFPGYLFCRFDPCRRLPILTTPGVVSVIGFGGVPAPIPDAEIDAIRKLIASSLPVAPHPFLAAGQPVRVVRGPLVGVQGFVVSVSKQFRLVASIELLQRSVCVEIDRDWIELLTTPRASAATHRA